MQQPTGRGAARPPIGIAFDGDVGNRIDAVLAIAMLNGLTARTQARRITLSVSRPSLASAQIADVVGTFYRGRPVAGPGGGIGAASEGLIGMPAGASVSGDAPGFAAALRTVMQADRQALAAKGRKLFASKFSWPAVGARAMQIYRSVLDARRGARRK